MSCSLFLKNLETHFCNVTCKKNFVKCIKNLSQHLSEKFIDYRYRFKKLRFIGIAKDFFEVIDYRYRFSTERFVVPITGYVQLLFYQSLDDKT